LSLYATVKMSLLVMWSMRGWTGTNARYPRQQWQSNKSLLGEE
jgi:hypothetical protein